MSDLVNDWFDDASAAIKRYGCKSIVETGTGPNSSALALAGLLGLPAASCDVCARHVATAKALYPEQRVVRLTSPEFLAFFMFPQPAFYWLDAHNVDQGDSLPGDERPLWYELKAIKRYHPFKRDVIWCDDADQDWYDIEELKAVLADTHTAELVGPVLRFSPKWS